MQLSVDGDVENVYVFVSDALRYDYAPESLRQYGDVVRTIASATNTCTSFPTLVTGRYPPEHGVWTFSGLLPEGMPTVYDYFPGESPGFYTPHVLVDSVDQAAHYGRLPAFYDHLARLEPPYFVLDRDTTPHLPFGYDAADNDQLEIVSKYDPDFPFETPDGIDPDYPSSGEYLAAYGNDHERLVADYERGCEMSVARFESRLRHLREHGLLENTLVVFTADHGEELGEYGRYTHGESPVPETVTVPTVFYMEGGEVTVQGEFVAHVDLFPTIVSAVGSDFPSGLPGYDLATGAPDDRTVFSANMNRAHTDSPAMDWARGTPAAGTCSRTPASRRAC